MSKNAKKSKIQNKMISYIWICVLPFVMLFAFSVVNLIRYYQHYDRLVQNITSANKYNLSFKSEIDEMMYRIIIGSANWSDPEQKLKGDAPIELIDEAIAHFEELRSNTVNQNVKSDIKALIKLLGILKERVNDILANVEEGGHYDENMEMLDLNIRTLTSLVQDDIQTYIYDEATNMENLRKQVQENIIKTLKVLIIVTLIVTAFVVIVSRRLARGITKPITELCDMTEKFAGGDFSVSYYPESNDEMQTLAESFNTMVGEIETLIEDIHQEQENAKDAELRLMQEQINPHFLYNTLDAIIWLTESGEKKQAVQMIQELSTFFRVTLSKGRKEITIGEEREQIRSYLEIQHFRYQDILEYEINFDENILGYQIQKLTLQPIVENALYHGIKNKRGMGRILVTGECVGEDIIFKIKDNGIGMPKEKLEHLIKQINDEDQQNIKEGFGMANVQARIRMKYGDSYGMTIESVYQEGTTVTVKIPKGVCEENQIGLSSNLTSIAKE